jgi:acetyl-CoA C-acetyltransferase
VPKGEGQRFIREHNLTFKGDFPLNTHGGQLSFGQSAAAGGYSQVIEAFDQISHSAQERQLKSCDNMFVSGTGGVMSEQGALILQGG